MKKDILSVVAQFILFALYFTDWKFFDYQLPVLFQYLSIGLVVIGLVIVVFGILSLNVNFSPFPTPKSNSSLISHGIYKYVRHPVYSGIILALLAYSLFSFSVFRLAVTALLVLVLYFKTNLEERLLRDRFSDYADYMKRTGRFFPKMNQ